jgi:hypothetical protein
MFCLIVFMEWYWPVLFIPCRSDIRETDITKAWLSWHRMTELELPTIVMIVMVSCWTSVAISFSAVAVGPVKPSGSFLVSGSLVEAEAIGGRGMVSLGGYDRGQTPMIDPDITQKQKREILENDKKVRAGTYKSLAEAECNSELGGRYSAAVSKTTFHGWGSRYPGQPASSPWHHDPCGIEPPLGFSVEEMPTTGEWWEVEASLKSQGSLASPARDPVVASTSSVVGDSKDVGVKPKWRRI